MITAGGGPSHESIGFRYWHNPGPFVQYLDHPGSLGRFMGFWTTFSNAVYAYSGVEAISMAAAETRSPRRNIPKAAKRIFWRVLLFYGEPNSLSSNVPWKIERGADILITVVSILMVTLLVPSNDPELLQSSGTAAASPFVIAATRAGVKAVPSIINFVVLTSAWSAGNSGMLLPERNPKRCMDSPIGVDSFVLLRAPERISDALWSRSRRTRTSLPPANQPLGRALLRRPRRRYLGCPGLHVTQQWGRHRLYLAARSGFVRGAGGLDRDLHRLPPILLRHEEAGDLA